MREIKFRAFNGMGMEYNVVAGKFGHFYVNPYNNGMDEKDSTSLTPFNTKYEDTVPLMQFTGLKDKNGKEIYEGDIISSDNFSSNLVIGYSNEKAAFVGSRTNSFKISEIYNFLDDIVIDDNWEVIGNIYESPELLKQKEG